MIPKMAFGVESRWPSLRTTRRGSSPCCVGKANPLSSSREPAPLPQPHTTARPSPQRLSPRLWWVGDHRRAAVSAPQTSDSVRARVIHLFLESSSGSWGRGYRHPAPSAHFAGPRPLVEAVRVLSSFSVPRGGGSVQAGPAGAEAGMGEAGLGLRSRGGMGSGQPCRPRVR